MSIKSPANLRQCKTLESRGERCSILYFGNDWYGENRTSSHHIALRLARDHDVYYLECPGLRAPQKSGRDFAKIAVKLCRFLRGVQTEHVKVAGEDDVTVTLHVRTLIQIPLHRFRLVRAINYLLLLVVIKWLVVSRRILSPVAWHTIPHLSGLCGAFNEAATVYYCIDDYSALPGVSPEAVQAMDDALTKYADVVFVASETLYDRKRAVNARTFLSPHGVDLEHFARDSSCPAEEHDGSFSKSSPVIGYFGLIERWIDLELISELARRQPSWMFLMIGRVAVEEELLPKEANIKFLGPKPYALLPSFASAFDVSLIPSRSTQFVYHANPLKLREYLALGKPVVSARTPQTEKFSDVIYIADSVDDFENCITLALRPEDQCADKTAERRNRVREMSWNAVVEKAWARVLEVFSAESTLCPR